MADIKKELNDIKNAVYGREVRGSIHDGIKKINEESEESKRKAEEAHEITQDLLDETFDSAALEANFEQRLNDEIANLQPEWTGFKNDVTAKLAETANAIGINIDAFPRLAPEVTDTGRIRRMMNSIPEDEGAVLIFNNDTYLIGESEIELIRDNLTFMGKGANTIIKLVDNVISSNALLKAYNKENISFLNMVLDGNKDNQANTYHMLRLEGCINPSLENVVFRNIHGTALNLTRSVNVYVNRLIFSNITGASGNPGEGLYGLNIKGGSVNNVVGMHIGDHLIYIDTSGIEYAENMDFVNVIGYFCGENGLTYGATFNICNDSRNFTFTNCHSINSRSGFYFHENGISGVAPSGYSLMNCSAINSNFGSGFDCRGVAGAEDRTVVNAKLIGCISKGNIGGGSARGFRIQDLEGITLTDCEAIGNGLHGIWLTNVKRGRINVPNLLNNGQASTTQAIRIGGGEGQHCDDVIIRGGSASGETHSVDIAVLRGSTNVQIIGGDYEQVVMDDNTGVYKPDDNIIEFMVTANNGDGTLSIKKGGKYLDSVTSIPEGINIKLKNIPSTIIPSVNIVSESSIGFGTDSAQMEHIYVRSVSNTAIQIGLKERVDSSHKPLSSMSVGSISFVILL